MPVAERPRRRSSKPDRRVRLPPGTLTLFDNAADEQRGPVGNPADHPRSERGMLGVQLPPGPLRMPWRTSPEWSPRPHRGEHGFKSHPGYCNECVGWAPASPSGCNPPAPRCVGSTPTRRTPRRPVRLSAEDTSLSNWGEGFDSPTGYCNHVLVVPAEWPPAFQAGERGFESRPGC